MDRRLFLTGLIGAAGTAAFAAALPRQAGAAVADPLADLRPPRPDDMPEWEVAETPVEEGEQYAVSSGSGNNNRRRPPPSGRYFPRHHHGGGHHRRRRRRYRHWRRNCYWRYGRRICRRVPIWIWGWY
ncbi:hypothetical protein IZ6_28110 [Terrihabitans soli]|uniref:Protamine-2 (Modular protein) n=1 Tax=Terrihabitans soli TaxID=708113 RepID=A0A6S6QR68_9HYPH|nr:hypothetical protein [Terrihabitans soli]BCJ92076.1 hypothetical protein IZ6_28110 [Terrihabitans soli]